VLTNTRSDRVRSVRALSRRSARSRAGRFLVEGPQGVREAVRWTPHRVVDVYATPAAAARHGDLLDAAAAAGLHVHHVADEVLAAMCDTSTPQGLAAVATPGAETLTDVLGRAPRLLVLLTHVRDPGNAGTVIRGADAAGADAVLVSTSSVDVWSPKVVRSTAGSIFHLPVVTDLDAIEAIGSFRAAGLLVLAADGSGERALSDAPLGEPHAWVLGNEAWGLTADVREACDAVVRVPIHGRAESLNLAMAATVCLYASADAQHGPDAG
jgi:TrmH family RNA methyltransferase